MRAIAGTAVALLLVFSTGRVNSVSAYGQPADTDVDCAVDDAALAHAASLRDAVGLPSDRDTVAASYGLGGYSCADFGIPLSSAETQEFYEVIKAQTELSDYVETVMEDPDFAGAYLDGAHLTLASLDGVLGDKFEPSAGTISLVAARYSDAELTAIAGQIADLTRDPDSGNTIEIRYVNANPRLNRVEVQVAGDLDEATEKLRATYGDIVIVTQAQDSEGALFACNVYDCDTRGGVAINHFSPQARCTTGFLVRAKLATAVNWSRYILTAGHCVNDAGGAGNTSKWRNGQGNSLSDPYTLEWGKNQFQDFWPWACGVGGVAACLQGDLGLIGLNSVVPDDWNEYVTGASWRSITGTKTRAQQQIGQIVCRNGRTSAHDCGAITGKADQITYNFGFANVFNSVQVGLTSAGGDSGSGFYRVPFSGDFADAYGILSGGTGSTTWYFAVQPFYKSALFCDPVDIQVCMSASCPL